MSPASSKLKSKDKKGGKEPLKLSSKPSGLVNSNGGIPASGYNPLLGTFHTYETAPAPSASPLNVNGRFRNIDDTDDHNGNPYGAGIEYDAVSNNDSWSGESEDHKEKPSQPLRQESIPGADADKREKIRQKNERKHQRQKERRAQELHERCTGFLMSRKLEALAQQLVAMGFPHERATMALILNEGRVEESVAWLFEAGEEDKHIEHNPNRGGSLKIDITGELAKMTEMEMRYKVSKQEVERAIVSCEGDIENAEESLKAQKQDPPVVPPKPEATGDLPVLVNGKLPMAGSPHIMTRVQVESKTTSSASFQQKRDDKDLNYAKVPVTVGPSINSGTKSMQLLKKVPSKQEWAEAQQIAVAAEKHWPSTGSNPSVSYSLTSPLQASIHHPSKMDARYLPLGNELKNLQLGSVREPVVMDRAQTMSMKQTPSSSIASSPPGTAMGRYHSDATNGFVLPVSASRSHSSNSFSSNPLYNQLHYQSQQPFMPNGNSMDSTQGNCTWNRSASPILLAASSLGLFSRLGTNDSSTGSSSHVDWNTGCSMLQPDYTNIDWSLDLRLLQSKSNGLWSGSNHSLHSNTTRAYDSFAYGVGVKSGMLPGLSNGNGSMMKGFQEGVGFTDSTSTGDGGQDWTSPFEEKDLFSLSRQFVSPPSL